ncbi:MAG: carbamate kinase [Bacteroidales bacterium]|nr:carbamate kinase [Bacteroidales bacterium]
MKKLAVVALGGNALLRDNEEGTIDQQEQNTFDTLENLVFLLKRGYNLVITHGNGPQVGNIVMRNHAAEELFGIPQMPLDICVADSQGGIGYMIERMLMNVLKKHGLQRNILALMTMVEVAADDPAFNNPTKRIGRTVSRETAEKFEKKNGWVFRKEVKHPDGYRRVVPSPMPKKILNWEVIEKNAREGTLVIAVGGGGIPVYVDEKGDVRPSEAVIDKDLASSMLAVQIKADELYILTDVPYIYANYGMPDQEILEFLNYKDAKELLDKGCFGEGSMAPKVRAALHFIKHGGVKSIITDSTKLEDKTFGSKLTMEYDEADLHKYD